MFANREHLKLQVLGMSCTHCATAVERAIKGVDGVRRAKVALEERTAIVTAREGTDLARVLQAIRDAGYEARQEA